ncbi:thy-1 membrane glycoprotein [Sebastes fasciatus]|uniref:thy-1 membrane glycoprotein n=1 Tax=Sebastes fasciatus TaxID=394691 RepID=UPI003D9E7CE9
MLLLVTILLFGFASGQKVIQLNYCSLNENNLRMDCKYAVPAESPEPFCKYTNGERLFDTTDPDEEQHAPFKKRARARIFPGNICRFLFKNLPNGKSNFTCTIRLPDVGTASKTSVVEKRLLLPCSAWSVLLQSCSGLLLTLMTLPLLLEIHWL